MRYTVAAVMLLIGSQAFAANCYVLEFNELARDQWSNRMDLANLSTALAEQKVTYTTSTQSAAFNASTRYLRVICDATAHFNVEEDPTAAATNSYVTADVAEYFAVNPGDKIAFYDGSS